MKIEMKISEVNMKITKNVANMTKSNRLFEIAESREINSRASSRRTVQLKKVNSVKKLNTKKEDKP